MVSKTEKAGRIKKLETIVAGLIETEPVERDKLQWACRPVQFYCDQLDISPSTLQRMLREPPFQTREGHTGTLEAGVMVGGSKVTLIRVGEHVMTANEAKHHMAKRWLKYQHDAGIETDTKSVEWAKTKRQLYMMACELPPVWAVKLFNWSLTHWQDAAAAMKIAAQATPGYKVRFYEFPTISYLCHFWRAAFHAYLTHLSFTGQVADDPEQFNAIAKMLELTDPFAGWSGSAAIPESAWEAPLFAKPKKLPEEVS